MICTYRAFVTGPHQGTCPWKLEVRDGEGKVVEYDFPGGGVYIEKATAEAVAKKLNGRFQLQSAQS